MLIFVVMPMAIPVSNSPFGGSKEAGHLLHLIAVLDWPITCAAGYQCVVAQYNTVMGCCPAGQLDYCGLPTTCLDFNDLGACDAACQADYHTLKW